MTINSEPSGAKAVVDGVPRGTTPLTIHLKRKTLFGDDKSATVRIEGYQDQQVHLASGVNPWFFGNVVSGGLIGSITDGISGAAFKYSPDAYYVTLNPPRASRARTFLRTHSQSSTCIHRAGIPQATTRYNVASSGQPPADRTRGLGRTEGV